MRAQLPGPSPDFFRQVSEYRAIIRAKLAAPPEELEAFLADLRGPNQGARERAMFYYAFATVDPNVAMIPGRKGKRLPRTPLRRAAVWVGTSHNTLSDSLYLLAFGDKLPPRVWTLIDSGLLSVSEVRAAAQTSVRLGYIWECIERRFDRTLDELVEQRSAELVFAEVERAGLLGPTIMTKRRSKVKNVTCSLSGLSYRLSRMR